MAKCRWKNYSNNIIYLQKLYDDSLDGVWTSDDHDHSMSLLEHVSQSDVLSRCMSGHLPIRCTLCCMSGYSTATVHCWFLFCFRQSIYCMIDIITKLQLKGDCKLHWKRKTREAMSNITFWKANEEGIPNDIYVRLSNKLKRLTVCKFCFKLHHTRILG